MRNSSAEEALKYSKFHQKCHKYFIVVSGYKQNHMKNDLKLERHSIQKTSTNPCPFHVSLFDNASNSKSTFLKYILLLSPHDQSEKKNILKNLILSDSVSGYL